MQRGSRLAEHEGLTMKGKKNWIAGAIKKPGSLRKILGVKKGKSIPEAKLEKAANSKNPTTKKRAVLAKTLKSFKK
jgi:hypothetical protein